MQAILLSAGASSRFWPLKEGSHKSLIPVMGRPLIGWTLKSLERAGVNRVVVVESPDRPIEPALSELELNLDVQFARQQAPTGMADGLLAAEGLLDESFLVLHGHQFAARPWIEAMVDKQRTTDASAVLCGQSTETPSRYGMLALEGDRVRSIVEKPTAESTPSNVRALGIYLLPRRFIERLHGVPPAEYAFETALAAWMAEHDVRGIIRSDESPSLKYPWDLFAAARMLLASELRVGQSADAVISPLAHLEGPVHLGPRSRIYEYAVVKGPCYIGPDCVVGTHSLVRDGTVMEAGARIGAHAEVTRSLLGPRASTHSGFFGDAIFDREARAGAGTVTANVKVHRDEVKATVKGERIRTGLRSFGTVVGAEAQLGINVSTMPGVLIGARAFVEPGSVVKENVPSDSRYPAR